MLRFKKVIAMLCFILIITCCMTGCHQDESEPVATVAKYELQNLEKTELIKRPMVVATNIPTAIAVYTPTSKAVTSNVLGFHREEGTWQSVDGLGIVYKAVVAGDGMVLNISPLITSEDILQIYSQDTLNDDAILYESDDLTISFKASEYASIETCFYQYKVSTVIGAGDFTYSLLWKKANGDIEKSISLQGSVKEDAILQIHYDGNTFVVQSNVDILDPRTITFGIRSNEFDTQTIYPAISTGYKITILEDGTSAFELIESELHTEDDNQSIQDIEPSVPSEESQDEVVNETVATTQPIVDNNDDVIDDTNTMDQKENTEE